MMKIFMLTLMMVFVNANEWFGKMDEFNNIIPDGAASWTAIDDKKSNLMWEAKTANNVKNVYKWKDGANNPAIEYCENLELNSYSDWRLPNVNELKSLIDYTRSPVVDETYFQTDSKHVFYWSSSTVHLLPDDAWFLNVENGLTFYNGKTSEYAVRCVRGGF